MVRAFRVGSARWAMIYGVWSATDVGLWLLVEGRYVVDTIESILELFALLASTM